MDWAQHIIPNSDPLKSGEMPPTQSLEGATVQAQLTGSGENARRIDHNHYRGQRTYSRR